MKLNGVGGKHYSPLPQCDDEPITEPPPHKTPVPGDNKVPGDLSTEPIDERELPMSTARKICFVLSLIAAALFVVSLGWLIPCRYGALLPLESVPTVAQEWTFDFSGLVLTSNLMSSITPERGCKSTVHLGFERPGETLTWGLLAVDGKTGNTLWETQLYGRVAHHTCYHFCIAVGDGTSPLLAALNKSDGTVLWYAHDHNNATTIETISEVEVAPDCNGDGMPDFVAVLKVRFAGESRWAATVVSGSDGRLVSTPLHLRMCTQRPAHVTLLPRDQTADVFFFCRTLAGDGVIFKTTLSELCNEGQRNLQIIWSKASFKGEIMLRTLTGDDAPSLIVGWGKGHLMRLTGPHFTKQWSIHLALDSPIRTMLVGHFKAFAMSQLFVASDHNVHSTLFQLVGTATGQVEWRMQYDNATVHVAHLVPGLSKYVDGALLKATVNLSATRQDAALWEEKLRDPNYASYVKLFRAGSSFESKDLKVKSQEEQYFVLDFTNHTVDMLSRLVVQQLCIGGVCRPDIFSDKENVAMQVLDCSPGSYYLAFATTSASRASNSSVPEDTLLKVSLLTHQAEHCCDIL
ncbi:uncharacterized protein LOC135391995 [Ornithodoros turicata]|uniref:uncharacterized protein LOC135391995 n=1 Tax=Ornithodoros turicata TaxID=34597 RepID=UPI00313934C0